MEVNNSIHKHINDHQCRKNKFVKHLCHLQFTNFPPKWARTRFKTEWEETSETYKYIHILKPTYQILNLAMQDKTSLINILDKKIGTGQISIMQG